MIEFHSAELPVKFAEIRLVHPSNAPLPIEVTVSGIVILLSAEQFLNAFSPTAVTVFGIETL